MYNNKKKCQISNFQCQNGKNALILNSLEIGY